jgi:hypothetical protein
MASGPSPKEEAPALRALAKAAPYFFGRHKVRYPGELLDQLPRLRRAIVGQHFRPSLHFGGQP